MNDLQIDFSEKYQVSKVRQRFYTYIGIAFCIIGILTLAFNKATLSQIISSSCNFMLGLAFIIQVNPMIFKWTKCFINISAADIEYKFWGIQRKTYIKWDSVKSLTMNFNEIYFDLDNNKTIRLNLAFVSDSTIRKIKQSILGFGNEKGIKTLDKND